MAAVAGARTLVLVNAIVVVGEIVFRRAGYAEFGKGWVRIGLVVVCRMYVAGQSYAVPAEESNSNIKMARSAIYLHLTPVKVSVEGFPNSSSLSIIGYLPALVGSTRSAALAMVAMVLSQLGAALR